ncbi:MAG: helix-turn-helix domain-containing protein [Myxococcota bacterium]
MSRKRFQDMNCGVAQTLEQVGDWWTLLIVRDAFLDKTRFSEFQESLGIAKNILSDRLRKLVENGILEKERLDEPGARYAYRLTKKGRDLWLVLTAMRLWSDRWVFGERDVPLVAREEDSHREVAALLAVDRDGDPVEPGKLEWAPGPAPRRRAKRRNAGARR